MAIEKDTVFSEFFFDQLGVKPAGAEETTLIDCVGKITEEIEMKTVTKSCRGRVKKSRTRPSSGTVTVTMHMPYALYLSLYDMKEVATGVHGYGTASHHKESVLTVRIKDEDDNVKYKAYPVASLTSKSAETDDDADEVAMVELEFAISADDKEMLVYEALATELGEEHGEDWMKTFSQEFLAGLSGS